MPAPLSRLERARQEAPHLPDRDHVRGIAARLIDRLDLDQPPVDVEMVASLLGIGAVTLDPALPQSGCLLHHGDGHLEIRVRASDGPGRRRFTTCHELAHTFFPGYAVATRYRCSPSPEPRPPIIQRRHRTRAGTGGDPARPQDVETLCDAAASELLLPSQLFGPDVRATTFSLDGLGDLGERYGASLEATGNRLVDAWPEPAALAVLTVRRKPAEAGTRATPRLRLLYAHRRGPWPHFLTHKSATPGGPLHRALDEEVAERAVLDDICHEPVRAEIHARACPIVGDGTGTTTRRVVALLRRVRR